MSECVDFKRLLLMCLCVCSIPLAWTQQNIRGRVKDVQGELIAGANIIEKGTTNGTYTDINGEFSIQLKNDNSLLVISIIGYSTNEVVPHANMEIVLQEDARQFEEVVVVGYGTQRKVNLTGAVEAVGSTVFEGRSVSNITQVLVGAIPNLNINLSDGKLHRTASFNVRGTGSIGQGGNALILIDGVEGDPSLLNPNDIESVSVLKDAASAAIYGARGAFGVVLITTKSPLKGKTTVNYTGNYSTLSRAKKPEYVTDAVTFIEHFREAWMGRNGGSLPVSLNNDRQLYSDEWLDRLRAWKASGEGQKVEILSNGNYEYYSNTDWFGLLYKDHSFVQDHNLSISGSNDRGDFYVSGRFFDSDGMYRYNPDIYRAYNLRAKGSLLAYKWLRVTNNMEYSNTFYHQPLASVAGGQWSNTPSYIIQLYCFPSIPMYNPDGTYTRSAASLLGGFIDGNTYQDQTQNQFKNTVEFSTNFNNFRINGNFTFNYNTNDLFRKYVKVPWYINANTSDPSYEGDTNGEIYEMKDNRMYTAFNLYAEYENTFVQKHDVKAMAGWNYETSTYQSSSIQRNQLLLESAASVQLATGSSVTPNASYTRWRTAGAFFRLNYGYRNRYLVEVNGRYDGSSRFPTDQQWGFFPSISGAWRLSEESFWNVNPTIFSDVKFRVSYGSLGNGNINPYTYLETLRITNSGRVIDGALNKRTGIPAPIPDGLTWEKATTTDFGLDFGMLKGRLRFGGDYYIRKTTDMYVEGPILPDIFGAEAPYGNYAEMTTKGFELTLSWQDQFRVANKLFSYKIRGTLHDYVSKIDKFNNPTRRFTEYYDGMVIGELWGFETDGLFQNDPSRDEYINTYTASTADGTWHAGDIKIKKRDMSTGNMITKGEQTVDNPGDMLIIGNTQPRYQYSFNLNIDWNGFFFSAFFQGVGKQDYFPGYESAFWGQFNRGYNHIPAWHLGNYWTPDNRDAYLPRYAQSNTSLAYNGSGQEAVPTDRYLQNVAYLRLRNLQIGYSLPDALVSGISMQSAYIYLSGENLASWSPVYKVAKNFMDVFEITQNTDTDIAGSRIQGSGNGYPLLRTVSLGISLVF